MQRKCGVMLIMGTDLDLSGVLLAISREGVPY